MGEGDEDVGEDDRGVGVDCRHTMMAPTALQRHQERGGESPPFFFFLDLVPRWEKGFPFGPCLPWHGRGESPSKIGSVSLSPSVSVLSDSSLSPFLKFPEIRNSDWAEILTRFVYGYCISCAERRHQPLYRVAMRSQGAPLSLEDSSGIVSR